MKRDFLIVNGEPCHEIEQFVGDREQLAQIVPQELTEPLASLLFNLANIRLVRRSFGRPTLNERVAVEALERDAINIERACKELWRDL